MNAVMLMGNLTRDPEIKFTPKGQAVVEFSIAVNKKWTTEAGESRERVTFVSCVCWGNKGEVFAKHHRRGSRVLVEGELVQEEWEKDGQKRSKTRVQVREWHFATPKATDAPEREQNAATGRPQRGTRPTQPAVAPATAPDDDDNLPF